MTKEKIEILSRLNRLFSLITEDDLYKLINAMHPGEFEKNPIITKAFDQKSYTITFYSEHLRPVTIKIDDTLEISHYLDGRNYSFGLQFIVYEELMKILAAKQGHLLTFHYLLVYPGVF